MTGKEAGKITRCSLKCSQQHVGRTTAKKATELATSLWDQAVRVCWPHSHPIKGTTDPLLLHWRRDLNRDASSGVDNQTEKEE